MKPAFWQLGAIVLVTIALVGWVVSRQRHGAPRTETQENLAYLKNVWKPELDPKVGTPLPGIPPSAIHLPSPKSSDRSLVIAIGSCESCTAKSFDADWLIGTDASRVVALYLGEPPKSEGPLKPPFTDRVYLSSAEFAKLNALWPRIYVLDSEGNLLAAQSLDETEDAFVEKWIK